MHAPHLTANGPLGGLIILDMFYCRQTIEECSLKFETLARQIFKKSVSGSLLAKFQKGVKCWMADGQYNDSTIESALKNAFGDSMSMFGFASQPAGIKVAVPALSISDAFCFLFTNYNTNAFRKRAYGTWRSSASYFD